MATSTKKKQSKSHYAGKRMYQLRSSTVRNVVFTNRKIFPSFDELPNNRCPNPFDYRPTVFDDIVPIRPWFFLGEITDARNAQSAWARHRTYVRDIDGLENINIDFYVDPSEVDALDYLQFKVGRTLCIRFGSQHYFLDGTHGIRVENRNKIQVFSVGLGTLMTTVSNEMKENISLSQKEKLSASECLAHTMGRKVHDFKYKHSSPGHCWNCQKIESEELKMKQCAKCLLASYCEKSCQIEHWNKSHKMSCKCLQYYTSMVTDMKTVLNNMSQHLLDFVSTDEEEEEGNDDQDEDEYDEDN